MTMTSATTVEVCTICHKPREGHNYHHEFSSAGGTMGLVKAEVETTAEEVKPPLKVHAVPGGDPVVRMALIRKGLLTVADLEAVEAELRATGVAGYEPPTSLAQP